jgi:hypothetical protein
MHPDIARELVRSIHADREREARAAALASLARGAHRPAHGRSGMPNGSPLRAATAFLSRLRPHVGRTPTSTAGAPDVA